MTSSNASKIRVSALVFALLASACSSTSTIYLPAGGGGGGGETDTSPIDAGSPSKMVSGSVGVGLVVLSASLDEPSGNDIPPPTGDMVVYLDVSITNSGAPAPLSTNFALFTLATSASLVANASSDSSELKPYCDPSLSVANGGTFECEIAFILPSGQLGTTLTYNDAKGDTATATLPTVASSSSTTTTSGGLSCSVASSSVCYTYGDLPAADLSAEMQGCTSQMGTIVTSCPTSGLAGCCTMAESGITTESCYYSGADASEWESACTSSMGTWSTSP